MSYQWQYAPAKDLDQGIVDRLRNFPRQPDIAVYLFRSFAALAIRLWFRIYHRLEFVGKHHLPKNSSCILVANHSSHLDAICLSSMVPLKRLHRFFPVAAMDYFFGTVPRSVFSAVVMNALPFGRYSNTKHSLKLCRQLLSNEGNILLIFPEGTRSLSGNLGEFKAGVGLLLAGMSIPAIPCYIDGAYQACPKGNFFAWPHKIRITVGAPMYFEDIKGKQSAEKISFLLHEAVDNLRKSIS
jgi:1-acyl-sn-glycerol-3-phosphate acyltransferase